MSFNRENYRRIRQDYETKYLRAREDADRRRSEAEAALPALRALDRELGTLGLELMRISMENAGNDTARQQALEALRTRNTELQARQTIPICATNAIAAATRVISIAELCALA